MSSDAISSAHSTVEELPNNINIKRSLQSIPTIPHKQIQDSKTSETWEIYETQNNALQQAKGQREMQKFLEGNAESIEQMKKQMSYVDLTEFGIDNTAQNKEEFQEYAEHYFSAFSTQLKNVFETPKVQNATTQAEQNKIISEEMEAFQNEYFPQIFNKFIQETNANVFTFEDILSNSLIHTPEVQEKLHNDPQYLAEKNLQRETSLASQNEKLPLLNADMDTYIEEEAKFIMKETNAHGKLKYLTQGTITAPFAEVIQFVKNGGGTLSPKAYSAYINMLNDERHDERKKWLQAKIKHANRSWKNDNDKYKQQEIDTKFREKQKDIVSNHQFYQLGMQRVAEKAQKIMNRTNPETGEKIQKETDFIQSITQNLTKEQKEQLIDSVKNKSHHTYTVENRFSEHADSSLEGQTIGRITPVNFVLDQVLRSGLMVMVFANILVGIQSGNWSGSLPLIGAGVLGTGLLGNGVMNSGIEKMLHPEKMLDNIVKESWNNKHYRTFFKNEWEVSLAQNMDWSPKKSIKKDIKTVKKKNGEKNYIYHTNENGEETRTKLSLSSYDRNIKKTFKNSLTINDFKEENPMSKYLQKSHYLGPDGIMYTKEEYLQKVEEHSDHNSGNATQTSNHVRFIMYEKIADRIGQKDSYLPLLNQLHDHYKHSQPN